MIVFSIDWIKLRALSAHNLFIIPVLIAGSWVSSSFNSYQPTGNRGVTLRCAAADPKVESSNEP